MLDLPRFSLPERDQRWAEVRRLMGQSGIDCLVVWGDSAKWDSQMSSIRYLTQIGGNGEEGVLVFPRKGEPTIFIWSSLMEPIWRQAQDWITDIRGQRGGKSWAACIQGRLKELGVLGGRIGLVSGSLRKRDIVPYHIYTELAHEIGQDQISDATDILETARLVKTQEEIKFIQRAGEIGDTMTNALKTSAHVGIKECEVFAEVIRAMVAQGGEYPTLVLWGCGPGPDGPGPLAHPGRFPTTRTIQAGDVIIMEMHPKYAGYVVHQERTVFVGEPRKLYRDLYDAALSAFKQSVELLTPEFSVGEPVKVLRDAIKRSGFSFREAGIQGHGLESGDPPNVGAVPFTLEACFEPFPMPAFNFTPGMVVMLNIDITTPDWSTSVQLADTYVITESEPRKVTKYDLEAIMV